MRMPSSKPRPRNRLTARTRRWRVRVAPSLAVVALGLAGPLPARAKDEAGASSAAATEDLPRDDAPVGAGEPLHISVSAGPPGLTLYMVDADHQLDPVCQAPCERRVNVTQGHRFYLDGVRGAPASSPFSLDGYRSPVVVDAAVGSHAQRNVGLDFIVSGVAIGIPSMFGAGVAHCAHSGCFQQEGARTDDAALHAAFGLWGAAGLGTLLALAVGLPMVLTSGTEVSLRTKGSRAIVGIEPGGLTARF